MLKIYNTLTRKKQEFVPIYKDLVNIYVCGVTVYDYCHIGHARTCIFFDTVARYLMYSGYQVNLVRNITDVDDKILLKAQQQQISFNQVALEFTAAMHADLAKLNLLAPTQEPKATDYIASMINLIAELLAKDYAYIGSNGDVFYAITKFSNYANLANRELENIQNSARLDPVVQAAKRENQDFVLWKLVSDNEVGWNSPWGFGRPGWHTECAAMTLDLFKQNTFDIHGGGADLIFPHHSNEIAQVEAITNKNFVNYWIHVGLVRLQQEKMSKSLGNSIFIRDILAEHDPEVLKFFILTSHYRSQIEFQLDKLAIAKSSLERLYLALRGVEDLRIEAYGIKDFRTEEHKIEDHSTKDHSIDNSKIKDRETKVDSIENLRREDCKLQDSWTKDNKAKILSASNKNLLVKQNLLIKHKLPDNLINYINKFKAAMDDDFNTPLGLTVLFELSKELNLLKEDLSNLTVDLDPGSKYYLLLIKIKLTANTLVTLGNAIGLLYHDSNLFLQQNSQSTQDNLAVISSVEIEELILQREQARIAKDWKNADLIRQQLLSKGILLEDLENKTLWRRI